MNYIIFDLEFNQGYKYKRKNKSRIDPKCMFEIIQIGAIKLNEDLETVGHFDLLVKPKVYLHLHNFIADMTDITIEKLESSDPFDIVYKKFVEFIGEDSILCTWGVGDMRELVGNIKYHKLDLTLLPTDYIDIQRIASTYLKTPNGNSIGLKNAVEALDLPHDSQFHDAFNDAFYTGEVFKKIYSSDIEPITYNFNDNKSHNKPVLKGKVIVDIKGLIAQFEKMFGRKMTEEEKKLIKLAYDMGRTGQFQTRVDNEEGETCEEK